jgi:membrane protease YdiL (CAAX protease family)
MKGRMSPPEPRTSSSDPIAAVRLWPGLLLPFVIAAAVVIVLERSGASALMEKAGAVAGFATIVVWWPWAVAGATRRAGFRPALLSAGAVLKLSLKVALGCLLATLVWILLTHALGLSRVGLVEAPKVLGDERTLRTFAFAVLLMGLLAPVAEEMLFRGALFRKWRLHLGPAKAAVVTSVMFGLGHANAPSTALFALAMAVLYTTTRTLWAPVAAHVANNLFVVILSHSGRVLPLAVLEALADWPLQLASLVPGLAGTWWVVRFLRRGWHTLGDPVHGVPTSVAESITPATSAAS